ncbi:MAG: zinc ABC transporter substrate-binding protein [Candidatus Omnitrophica bacterium]|nr:zinc ABC transporter substrate-binding protein [Candidatus Omnitrophota bacterium]
MAILLLGGSAPEAAEKPLKVVATLPTFADLVRTIGQDQVDVSSIAPPRFNPHFIEPRPSDVVKVKRADLFVHAGLDLELWRGPLLDAAGNTRLFPGQERELDLSRGIALLEVPDRPLSRAEGDIHLYGNPHYWLDPENVRTIAQAICDKLCALDPQHEQAYHANLKTFLDRLSARIPEWRARLAPYKGRELVGYHNEWPYLMRFTGLSIEQFLEPKPGIPPTPKHVAFIEQYVRERGIPTLVQATYFPAEAAASVAKRTGVRVVLLCQSVGELPQCADYVGMIDYNVGRLAEALEGSS